MHLILWRHAEAVDGVPDLARPLSAKGHKQAHAMSNWLRPRLPRGTRILVSPAVRTRETVVALTHEFETVPEIAPGASPEAILAAVDWPEGGKSVLVVGHQPALGEIASMLLAGAPLPWSIKKGGVWWLSHRTRGSEPDIVLRAVMNPDLLV